MFGDPEGTGTTDSPETDSLEEVGTETGDETADSGKGKSGKTVTIPFDEYMSLKTQREAQNRARAESGTRSTTTDDRAPEAQAMSDRISARADRLVRLKAAAKAGNEDAQVLVDAVETVQESEQRQLYRMEMRDVPEAKRAEVQATMRREGFGSPFAAYKWMRGDEADALEIENKTLREKLAEKDRPRAKVEGTKMRSEVGRSSAKTSADGTIEISAADYARDSADPVKWAQFKAARRSGKLKIFGTR
jgi:hypothetical protein